MRQSVSLPWPKPLGYLEELLGLEGWEILRDLKALFHISFLSRF
jgi:hypothetical protein